MIADWTVEVAPESAIIVLPWEGWVDLHRDVHAPWPAGRAAALSEVQHYPELLKLLELANTPNTASAKIDVFPVTRDEVDPEIAEAGLEATTSGLCSYLDLLAGGAGGVNGGLASEISGRFRDFDAFEQVARETARTLNRAAPPLLAAIEIVVRPARLYDKQTFGWTLYASGFGPDEASARAAWAEAAELLLRTIRLSIDG